MSDSQPSAHIGRCGFCEQGLVRLYRCNACAAVSAICDECERIWRVPAEVHDDPDAPADAAHPSCPACASGHVTWSRLDAAGIAAAGLEHLVAGDST